MATTISIVRHDDATFNVEYDGQTVWNTSLIREALAISELLVRKANGDHSAGYRLDELHVAPPVLPVDDQPVAS